MSEALKSKLATLPMQPGCYLMKDKHNQIIYVGKAKKLKNRVNQYFKGVHDYKTTKLVSEIVDFDFIVTGSEKEALVLEINLIKKHRPKFNIMFMDDKTYPYIKITNEKYPTVKVVRDLKKDRKSKYYGPYPDATAAWNTMKLLNQLYPLRKCKNMPDKLCLYYHMGQCLGPCALEVDPKEYSLIIEKITSFLKGDVKDMIKELKAKMNKESENLEFEKAQSTLQLIQALEHISDRQQVQVEDRHDRDVFNFYEDKGYLAISGLLIRGGMLLEREMVTQPLYDDPNESFVSFLLQYYENHPVPYEIILPSSVEIELIQDLINSKLVIPQKGYRKKLLDLAKLNGEKNLNQKFERLDFQTTKKENSMKTLAEWCKIDEVDRIEIFDNSHISGQFTVSAMVVWQDLQFKKAEYRLFKLHTTNSDTDSMKEAMYRRYFRGIKEETRMPDLLLVDGGITQIHAAQSILEMLDLQIPLFGLVKDDKHNTSGLMNKDGDLVPIERNSDVFFFLTNLQDEVHRFAINYHRKLREKSATISILDEIEGVGPKRKKQLMNHFKSFKRIKEATLDDLKQIVPETVANSVFEALHSSEN